MSDLSYAFRVLLRALDGMPVDRPVHVDSVREQFDAAGVTRSAEKSGALRKACTQGYLRAIHDHLDDGTPVFWCVPSTSEKRKWGHSLLYARTALPIPAHVCEVTV